MSIIRGIRDPIPANTVLGFQGSPGAQGAVRPIPIAQIAKALTLAAPPGTTFGQVGNNTVIANISGSTTTPYATTLTAVFDAVMGNTQGAILYRSASGWVLLAPGSSTQFLKSGGASANPGWSLVSLTANVSGVLPVANGGTNASAAGATAANNIGALAEANNLSDLASASTARTNLGLGTMATENSSSVAVTGGTIDGTTIGGTTQAAGSFTGITLGTGTQLTQYVEGTFTPTLVSSGGGAPTYSEQYGSYTRIGNRVLFTCRVHISATGTLAAGNLTIAGLPIASNSSSSNVTAAAVHCNGLAATATTQIQAQIFAGATSITLIKYSAGAGGNLTVADLGGTSAIDIAGQYQL